VKVASPADDVRTNLVHEIFDDRHDSSSQTADLRVQR